VRIASARLYACLSAALLTAPLAAHAAAPLAEDASIYEVSPWVDGAIIVGTNAVTIGLYGFGSGLIDKSCPCDPAHVNSFDRHAIGNHNNVAYDIATATVAASAAIPLALDGWDLREWRPFLEDATVLVEALSVSGALTTAAKYGVQRPFPRTYAGAPNLVGSSSGYRSFFSGHTALTFSALGVGSMTVGRRYHVYVIPWVITVVAGASVGAGVVLGGWHFPTDVITGALVGTAVGVTVPLLHFRPKTPRPVVALTPGGGAVVGLVGVWR
jgi:membrane-associated phospholipid phosphatase